MGLNAVLRWQLDRQFNKGQVALFLDLPPFQIRHALSRLLCPQPLPCGLAASDAVARFESTMSVTTLIETRNCATAAPVRVTFLNKINNLPTKVHRNWLAPQ